MFNCRRSSEKWRKRQSNNKKVLRSFLKWSLKRMWKSVFWLGLSRKWHPAATNKIRERVLL